VYRRKSLGDFNHGKIKFAWLLLINKSTKINIVGFIHARTRSSNFPEKPLADIFGMPMVERVFLRARNVRSGQVFILPPAMNK
jgi:hypothetical protein